MYKKKQGQVGQKAKKVELMYKKKQGQVGVTDRPTNRPTNRRTQPVIEVLCRT